jgi:hypothetical protein
MTSKVTRVVELWQSKSFITTTDAARINEYMTAVAIPPSIEADYADDKVLTSPYLHSEILVNKSSATDTTSLSNYTATTLDSGGQSQEQLLKLQQIQQIQDQIQQHIAKLNQQQQPSQKSQPLQQQQQPDQVKPPREKLSAEQQPVLFQSHFHPPPPDNPPDSMWSSSFPSATIPGNMNMNMMMSIPGAYPNPMMLSHPQQQQQQQHPMGTFLPPPFTLQAPPPPPPPGNPLALPPSLLLDLTRMPVGQMSHLIKSGSYFY